MTEMLPIGTKTPWGEIRGIGYQGKPPNIKRYYWLVNEEGQVLVRAAEPIELRALVRKLVIEHKKTLDALAEDD